MTGAGDRHAQSHLAPGLYEQVLSGRVARLREAIHDLTTTRDLVPDEAPKYLSDYVAGALTRALQAPGVGSDLQRQLALPAPRIRTCRGRMFSRADYEVAIREWGFADADGDEEPRDG